MDCGGYHLKKETKKQAAPRSRSTAAKSRSRSPAGRGKAVAEKAPQALEFARSVKAILEDKHGNNVAILDVRGLSSVADFFVLVSGMNHPHLKAMFEEVDVRMKHAGIQCYRKVGISESGWLILDYVDVVIHILLEENRKYYAIEDLWAGARKIE